MLSFEETTSVDSIDALIGLYAQKGLIFPNQRNFINAVRRDWRLERKRLLKEVKTKEVPAQLPSLEVLVDGAKVRIRGVAHKPGLDEQVIALVTDAVNSSNHANWLFEQKVKSDFPKALAGIELPDFLLFYFKDYFAMYFQRGLVVGAKLPVACTIGLVGILDYWVTKLYSGISRRGKGSGFVQDYFTLQSLYFDRQLLNVPLRAFTSSLPAYVDIQLREMGNKKYNPTQRRSAYSAEFLRFWRANEEREIVVGAGHAPEVEYFLRHGVKSTAITELAYRHVELFEEDPEKFFKLRRQTNFKHIVGGCAGVTAAAVPVFTMYMAIGEVIRGLVKLWL